MAYFDEEFLAKAEKLCARYPRRGAALLPVLGLLQRERGFIATEAIDEISSFLGVPQSRVLAVAGFYTMLRRSPAGRYHIQVCRGISCHMAGATRLLGLLGKKLGVADGGTTPDGLFTVSSVECLGACGEAPSLSVNGAYFGGVDEAALDALLDDLRHGRLERR